MTVYLPQNDPEPQKRQDWLNRNRTNYKFNYEFLPPMAVNDAILPPEEYFSNRYLAERLKATQEITANMLAVQSNSLWDPLDELQDYEDFFPILPKPQVIKTYQTDASFAEQRLCGVNPLVLCRIKELPPNFSLAYLQTKFGSSLNLEEALANGNLYLADYSNLSFVRGGTYERGKNYLPTPIALFCWKSTGFGDRRELIPVAIQLNLQAGNSQILTPFDEPLVWFKAKICVQIADANHHELSTHLCRTHLVMTPFAIVTARQLAENHPLGLLLRPHFQFMLANTDLARQRLFVRGGPIDNLMAGSLEESLQIVKNAYDAWSFDRFAFPTEIKNRGMDDVESLQHYPYRDDGMLLWEAIYKYVSNYLKLYYKTAEDISQDTELQAWAKELVALEGGRVKGFPDRIETIDRLIEIVTAIIFTCGPLHSAINFPQYEYMAFVPNMPFAAYQPIADDLTSTKEQKSLMPFLPPSKPAGDQLTIVHFLSAYRYDRLGEYENKFSDPEAQAILHKFQEDLNAVERQIDVNNKSRLIPYIYLKPSLVTNSINI